MERADLDSQRGFTLVELMVSLVLFSFAVAGVLSVAVSITQGFREQRQGIATEQAARVPLDFLADALRQASPGVATPATVVDASGTSCLTGAINVTDNFTTSGGGAGADKLDIIYASGAVVTNTRAAFDSSSATTALGVGNATQFAVDDYVLLTNFSQGHLFKIQAVDTTSNPNTITFYGACATGITYASGSTVIRARHASFYIKDLDNIPTLYMDPNGDGDTSDEEPLAEGIEDMQIAVGIDADLDKTILDTNSSSDEWRFNASGDTPPNFTSDTVRAIRITLIARATQALVGTAVPFSRPAAENHSAGSADAYRRRVLRTIVDLRNVGGSP